MIMTGLFHITLSPTADESAFVTHMTDVVFKEPDAMQSVRNCTGIDHELLRGRGPVPTYAWQVRVRLMTDSEYNFDRNIERVQKAVEGMGTLSGLEIYVNVGAE
jgi:hypothetical protein